MAMLGVQSKEKELRPYQEKIDIATLLKMRVDQGNVVSSKIRISSAKRMQ
jgi:hypothetical protein